MDDCIKSNNEEVKISIEETLTEPNVLEKIQKSIKKSEVSDEEPTDAADGPRGGDSSRPPPPSYNEALNQPTVRIYRGQTAETLQARQPAMFARGQPDVQIIEVDYYEPFETKEERLLFVQRVYFILAMQLSFTFMVILLASMIYEVRVFFFKNGLIIMIVFGITFLASMIALLCCQSVRRSSPLNLILLILLTVSMAALTTILTVLYRTEIVLYAMGVTALVCLVVSVFACQTKFDITQCGPLLCILGIIFIVYGLIVMILHMCGIHMKILDIIFSSIAVFLFTLYLMYDTQQIMGGRRYQIEPDEYIYGAILLYIDIMYIFIHVLQLFGFCMDD